MKAKMKSGNVAASWRVSKIWQKWHRHEIIMAKISWHRNGVMAAKIENGKQRKNIIIGVWHEEK